MKKILFLLLITVGSYGQTFQNPTYGTIKLKQNLNSATATKVNVQEADGTVNTKPISDFGTVTSVTGTDGITVANGTTAPVIGISSISQLRVAGLVTDLGNKVDKVTGKSLLSDAEIARLLTLQNFDNSANVIALNTKVDKVTGKSLISDSEITRLSTVTNFDNSTNVTSLATKVDKVTGKSLLLDTEITRLGALANYTHPANHPPSIITQDASNRFVTDAEKANWNAKQAALGFTPENAANKNMANGYAGLGTDGKLISAQLPEITISDTFVTASQAAMLALIAQTGDVSVRTDLNKSFILKGTNPTILGDWQELLTPTSAVTTVFGRNGSITAQIGDYNADQITETASRVFQTPTQRTNNDATSSIQTQLNGKQATITAGTTAQYYRGDKTFQTLDKSAVGLANVNNTSDVDKPISTAQQSALNLKENAFSKNTAFNKNFGTTTGTVSEGNDARIINGQTAFNWGNHAGLYPTYNGAGATGTWGINITGNAATANNSTKWNGLDIALATYSTGTIPSALIYNSTNNRVEFGDVQTYRSFLGLGSNAYTSTSYLPLSGGVLSGSLASNVLNFGAAGSVNTGTAYKLYISGNSNYGIGVSQNGGIEYMANQQAAAVSHTFYGGSDNPTPKALLRIFGNGTLEVLGSVAAPTFNGALSGNASTATTAFGTTLANAFLRKGDFVSNSAANTIISSGIYQNTTGNGTGNTNFPNGYGIFNHYEGDYFAVQESYTNTAELRIRGRNDGQSTSWSPWKTVLDSSNFNVFALPLSGGTLSGALNGTSANLSSSVTANSLNISASDARLTGGNSTGRLITGNSTTTSYAEFNGSSSGVPDDIVFVSSTGRLRIFTGGVDRFTMLNNGATTFASSVTAANGIFGKQDFSFQGIQRVLTLNGDPVSGLYAPNSFRFYTTPGANSSAQKLTIRSEHLGTESGNLFVLDGIGSATFSSSVTASGFFQSSDRRLKTILKRDGDVAYFKWKDGRDEKTHIGYIAQEIKKEFPDQVQKDDKGMLSVNYIEVLVAKIQELEKRIQELEKK